MVIMRAEKLCRPSAPCTKPTISATNASPPSPIAWNFLSLGYVLTFSSSSSHVMLLPNPPTPSPITVVTLPPASRPVAWDTVPMASMSACVLVGSLSGSSSLSGGVHLAADTRNERACTVGRDDDECGCDGIDEGGVENPALDTHLCAHRRTAAPADGVTRVLAHCCPSLAASVIIVDVVCTYVRACVRACVRVYTRSLWRVMSLRETTGALRWRRALLKMCAGGEKDEHKEGANEKTLRVIITKKNRQYVLVELYW